MTPATIIKEAMADGVNLVLSPTGTIKASGDGEAESRWLPAIRDNKPAIMKALQEAAQVKTESLQAAAGDDWPDIKDDPEALDALAKAIQTRRMRERGEIPPHYTSSTTCKCCGAVPIFEGVPEHVEGCPWCFNRGAGLPLPKALH